MPNPQWEENLLEMIAHWLRYEEVAFSDLQVTQDGQELHFDFQLDDRSRMTRMSPIASFISHQSPNVSACYSCVVGPDDHRGPEGHVFFIVSSQSEALNASEILLPPFMG